MIICKPLCYHCNTNKNLVLCRSNCLLIWCVWTCSFKKHGRKGLIYRYMTCIWGTYQIGIYRFYCKHGCVFRIFSSSYSQLIMRIDTTAPMQLTIMPFFFVTVYFCSLTSIKFLIFKYQPKS